VNCINREYCKKIIILLAGQENPIHHHRRKEETFNVLSGEVEIDLQGNRKTYREGDFVVVERGVKHSFRSDTGAVFEEVSTTHYTNDSFYEDETIVANPNRKTQMTFWIDWLEKPIA
jgi:quercetin dioxygenase-like cupin family protein